jgi:hypothetical protein
LTKRPYRWRKDPPDLRNLAGYIDVTEKDMRVLLSLVQIAQCIRSAQLEQRTGDWFQPLDQTNEPHLREQLAQAVEWEVRLLKALK